MTWNYRIIRHSFAGETWEAIHEVYYDDGGNIIGANQDPACIISDNEDNFDAGFRWTLDRMAEALEKATLIEKDGKFVELED